MKILMSRILMMKMITTPLSTSSWCIQLSKKQPRTSVVFG
jgi:hypothetical protein